MTTPTKPLTPIGIDRYQTDLLDLRRMDCMDLMREYPDNHFELAIVDPPYGLKAGGQLDRMKGAGKLAGRAINTLSSDFDLHPPAAEYWVELFRISRQQVIWGGNYFPLPPTRGIIWWDKVQPWANFSAGELAWTSFDKPAAQFRFDNRTTDKIHPTPKPVALYKWLLHNYAKSSIVNRDGSVTMGDKILDTHMGSGSIAIACHYMGFHLTASELDEDYFTAAVQRIKRETAQMELEII